TKKETRRNKDREERTGKKEKKEKKVLGLDSSTHKRHRWIGRYEAHLWNKGSWESNTRENRNLYEVVGEEDCQEWEGHFMRNLRSLRETR
ncbi:hypothetical protein ABKV19_017483, partial [Rosa sericea]